MTSLISVSYSKCLIQKVVNSETYVNKYMPYKCGLMFYTKELMTVPGSAP